MAGRPARRRVQVVVTDIEGAITVKKSSQGVWGAFMGPRSEVGE